MRQKEAAERYIEPRSLAYFFSQRWVRCVYMARSLLVIRAKSFSHRVMAAEVRPISMPVPKAQLRVMETALQQLEAPVMAARIFSVSPPATGQESWARAGAEARMPSTARQAFFM